MKIRIKSEDGMPSATVVTLEDGTRLENIAAVDVRIRPDEFITAQIEFIIPAVDFVAEATVSESHLRELAAAHGFDLVKKEPGAI